MSPDHHILEVLVMQYIHVNYIFCFKTINNQRCQQLENKLTLESHFQAIFF